MVMLPSIYGATSSIDSLGQVYQADLQQSRQNSAPHHYARVAAAQARAEITSAAVTIVDPNRLRDAGQPSTGKKKPKHSNDSWSELDMTGIGICNLVPSLANYPFLTILHLSHNNLRTVPAYLAQLVHLKILDVSSNKIETLAPELGMITTLKKLQAYDNRLTTVPKELGTLYNLELLGLEGNARLDPELRNMLAKKGTKAFITWLQEDMPVDNPPPDREWISLADTKDDETQQPQTTAFSVLCFNLLSPRSAESGTYGYARPRSLRIEYRAALLRSEIEKHNADIVCVQEMEMNQYNTFFHPALKELGYKSVYHQKGRASIMSEREKQFIDGCAIFYKAGEFELLERRQVAYSQIALSRPDLKKSEDMLNRVMPTDNIGVLTLLEHKRTKNHIIAVNTHIHWEQELADVKLVQVGILINEVERFAKLASSRLSSATQIPTVICGDFNSTPNSGVYEFLSKGEIKPDHEDFGDYVYGDYTTQGLSHSLHLKSAYSSVGELPFTNYTPWFKDVIDYIWYSSNTLEAVSSLGGIDTAYMSKAVGFPNDHFPSDHIPIMTKLRLKAPPREAKEADFGSTSSRRPNEGQDRAYNNSSKTRHQ